MSNVRQPSLAPLAYALRVARAERVLLARVVALALLLGLVELTGLLSFPALMAAVGWGGGDVLERLPGWLAGWIGALGRSGVAAVALPLLAFAAVGSLQHLLGAMEARLNGRWHEAVFRDCLRGLLGGRFPALARLEAEAAAHVLCVQTERAAWALYYGVRLLVGAALLAAQFAVALLVFGRLALWAGLLAGATGALLWLLYRRWTRLGGEWSDTSGQLFGEVVAGLRGWDTILTDRQRGAWLDGFHGHLRRHIDTAIRFHVAYEKTSAGINLGGALLALVLLTAAYALGVTGGTLLMLGLLGWRALPRLKGWITLFQHCVQQASALAAVLPHAAPVAREAPAEPLAGPLLPLRVAGLRFAYDPAQPLLDQLQLELPQHGLIGISGPNGCGKTTLLRILAQLLPPDSGVFAFPGGEFAVGKVPDFREQVAYLSANPLLWGRTLGEYLECEDPASGLPAAPGLSATIQLLWGDMPPAAVLSLDTSDWGRKLSMGMRQKAALLRCLGKPAPLVCLDEPTQHLDAPARAGLIQILGNRARTAAVVAVTQDPQLLAACETVYAMKGGRLAPLRPSSGA